MTDVTPTATSQDAAKEVDHNQRNTIVLVLFTAITNLADGALKVGLPLIAVTVTDSPALVSGVFLTLTLPWLLTALHVGVLVDRSDRRVLLWVANAVRILVVGTFLVTSLTGTVNLVMIYIGGVILGVAEVVALTSAAALIPSVVTPPGREKANSWLTGAETVCNEFVGPFIGGVLVAIGAAMVLGATLVGYALTTVILVFLIGRFRVAKANAEAAEDTPKPSVNAQIREGVRFLWRQRLLRVMTLLVSVLVSLWGAWLALMPLYATQEMGVSPNNYGLLVGALGAGGVVGAVLVSTANRVLGRRMVMFANIPLTALLVAIPAFAPNPWLTAVGAFCGGLGGGLWVVNSRTISQTLVEEDMMGRYSSVARLFGWGSLPLGAGLAGLLAEWFSAQTAFAVFTVISLTVVVPFLRVFTPTVAAETEERIKGIAAA